MLQCSVQVKVCECQLLVECRLTEGTCNTCLHWFWSFVPRLKWVETRRWFATLIKSHYWIIKLFPTELRLFLELHSGLDVAHRLLKNFVSLWQLYFWLWNWLWLFLKIKRVFSWVAELFHDWAACVFGFKCREFRFLGRWNHSLKFAFWISWHAWRRLSHNFRVDTHADNHVLKLVNLLLEQVIFSLEHL